MCLLSPTHWSSANNRLRKTAFVAKTLVADTFLCEWQEANREEPNIFQCWAKDLILSGNWSRATAVWDTCVVTDFTGCRVNKETQEYSIGDNLVYSGQSCPGWVPSPLRVRKEGRRILDVVKASLRKKEILAAWEAKPENELAKNLCDCVYRVVLKSKTTTLSQQTSIIDLLLVVESMVALTAKFADFTLFCRRRIKRTGTEVSACCWQRPLPLYFCWNCAYQPQWPWRSISAHFDIFWTFEEISRKICFQIFFFFDLGEKELIQSCSHCRHRVVVLHPRTLVLFSALPTEDTGPLQRSACLKCIFRLTVISHCMIHLTVLCSQQMDRVGDNENVDTETL